MIRSPPESAAMTGFGVLPRGENALQNHESFRTKMAAKLNIIDYFTFYNGKRLHSKSGYQTPLEIEREFYKKFV
jgi:hypothetical protein